MATNFPSTSIDTLTNPTASTSMQTVSHAAQHTNANDAITALETKVGVNGSAITTTLDYKLSGVTGADKAVSKTGTETLTNKTLTSPTLNGATLDTNSNIPALNMTLGSDATGDIYYRNASGKLTRLPIGSTSYVLQVVGGLPSWNSIVANDISAKTTNSTGLNIAAVGTVTTLTWDTNTYDTASIHSTVTNTSRLTVSTTGKYLISLGLNVSGATSGAHAQIRLNGTTLIAANSGGTTNNATITTGTTISFVTNLTAADYVEAQAMSNDASARTLLTTATFFSIQKLA